VVDQVAWGMEKRDRHRPRCFRERNSGLLLLLLLLLIFNRLGYSCFLGVFFVS
jgi:hypothetical protein